MHSSTLATALGMHPSMCHAVMEVAELTLSFFGPGFREQRHDIHNQGKSHGVANRRQCERSVGAFRPLQPVERRVFQRNVESERGLGGSPIVGQRRDLHRHPRELDSFMQRKGMLNAPVKLIKWPKQIAPVRSNHERSLVRPSQRNGCTTGSENAHVAR